MNMEIFDLGLVDFQNAYQFQKKIFNDVLIGRFDSALIICRHYPVVTLGRQAKLENILISFDELTKKGIEFYGIERGGDVTYHGQGQLTAYPIFNLNYIKRDIHFFLRQLEEVIIGVMADFQIKSERRPGYTGVWVDGRKIASIGISIKKWITFHGLTINVEKEDLNNFSLIKPCGMDIQMTSMESVLNRAVEIKDVKEKLVSRISNYFVKEEVLT